MRNLKFYIEFEPCKECKDIIRELNEAPDDIPTQEESRKFLRHITYNHDEIVQAIVKDFPKQSKKEDFSFFR